MNEFTECRKIFAERLLELIGDKSILRFSKEVGIPERTVNGWIRNVTSPRMEYLVVLAKWFSCTVDFLVGLEDEFGNKTAY